MEWIALNKPLVAWSIQVHPILHVVIQEAHAAEILTKDTELRQIQQRLATEIQQKETQIEQLTSQLQVSM
jgi:hypothetical protein